MGRTVYQYELPLLLLISSSYSSFHRIEEKQLAPRLSSTCGIKTHFSFASAGQSWPGLFSAREKVTPVHARDDVMQLAREPIVLECKRENPQHTEKS